MKRIWIVIRSVLLIVAAIFIFITNNGEDGNSFVTYLAIGLMVIAVIDLIIMALNTNRNKEMETQDTQS